MLQPGGSGFNNQLFLRSSRGLRALSVCVEPVGREGASFLLLDVAESRG